MALPPTAKETPTHFGTLPTVFTRVCDIAKQLSDLDPPVEVPAHRRFVEQALSDSQMREIFAAEPFHLPDVGPLEKEWPTIGHRAAAVIAPLKDRVRGSPTIAHTGPDQFCYFDSAAHVGQWRRELDFHLPNAPDRAVWEAKISDLVHARDLFDRLKAIAYCAPSSLLLQKWTDTSAYGYALEENQAREIDAGVFAELESRLREPQTVRGGEFGRIARMTRRAFPPERLAQIERDTQNLDEQICQVRKELDEERQAIKALLEGTTAKDRKWDQDPAERARREEIAFQALVKETVRVVAEAAQANGVNAGDLARGPDHMALESFNAWKDKELVRLRIAPT
jgi:hypothetical protein